MQFEYDPERLIEEIRKRPGIWDFEDADYRAKVMRYQLWSEVVTELVQTDTKITKGEMRELEIQLQKKWKSIRDCFQKYINNRKRTKRPYIYYKQLQFLLKEDKEGSSRKEDENASSESEEGQTKRIWRRRKKLKIVKDEEQSSEEETTNYDNFEDTREYSNEESESATPAKVVKHGKKQVDEFAFANVDTQLRSEAEDPDKMFLLSLLPHFKTIPEEFRLNVKMELMQVLRNANYSTGLGNKII